METDLIHRARSVAPCDFWKVHDMIELTDNPEEKRELKLILSTKYHEDEYYCGIL